jgi:hypothetical protein
LVSWGYFSTDHLPQGRLAQLGERLPYKQDVGSSILSSPTIVNGSSHQAAFFLTFYPAAAAPLILTKQGAA